MKTLIIFALAAFAATAEGGTARITNGQTATTGQFPYLVSLLIERSTNSYVICGGALIGSEWILTAAHCVSGSPLNVIANMGAVNRNSPELSVKVAGSNVIVHSDYNSANVHNDIALVKIPPVTYTTHIQPIKLPAYSAPLVSYANQDAIISGWGGTYDGSPLPDNTQYATVNIMNQDVCGQTLDLIDSMLCVSTAASSTCGGDSGGPLALKSTNTLVGVASFVVGGCSAGYPAGFSRVTSFLYWIKKKTGISS